MTNWQDIVNVLRKIGQQIVVMDQDSTYVVMDLDRYNQLLDGRRDVSQLSEEEFLNEINRQVAEWRAGQDTEKDYDLPPGPQPAASDREDDTFYIEPIE